MAQWFKDLACHCCGTSSIPGNFLILRPWPKKRKRKEKKKKKDSLGSSLASSLLNLTKDAFGHPEHSLSVTKFLGSLFLGEPGSQSGQTASSFYPVVKL